MISNRRTAGTVATVSLLALMVVTALAFGAAGGALAQDGDGLAISEYNGDTDRYVAVQGDRCVQIDPLGDGHRTVEEYYDYRNPGTDPSSYTYSSHGTTHLQEDDTSLLFLHEGSDGLSLVFVHDRYEGDTEGGAATLLFKNLPEDGEWVVEDDNYDGSESTWDHAETSSRITSVWAEGRTDGGAFNGLEGPFAVEITPYFNDLADYRDGPGQITDWQLLSGEDHDPNRTSLNMNEPVTIRTGSCVETTSVSANQTATVGEPVDVEATITNNGAREETVTVPIAVDGEVIEEEEVTVAANGSETLTTSVVLDEAKRYAASVGAESVTIHAQEPEGDDMPGFGVGVALVALIAAAGFVRRRG
ncbi:PGF-CTERM sorting domain-containing protein [Halovivax limisalsi]|uniref:PGF-CTERM sorting domain-containing protein n=1 Tax=Halovivax limisalsi TaxID=1453760 RepID=UPI001FFCDD82|nr:PGF-CTERM sorting domain-containing protein [Halovivax limisalsi]